MLPIIAGAVGSIATGGTLPAILSAASPLLSSLFNDYDRKNGSGGKSESLDTSARIEQQLADFAPDYLTAAREATNRASLIGVRDQTLRSTAPGTTGSREWQSTSMKNNIFGDIAKEYERLAAQQSAQVLGQNAGKSVGSSSQWADDYVKNPTGDIAATAFKGLMNYIQEPPDEDTTKQIIPPVDPIDPEKPVTPPSNSLADATWLPNDLSWLPNDLSWMPKKQKVNLFGGKV